MSGDDDEEEGPYDPWDEPTGYLGRVEFASRLGLGTPLFAHVELEERRDWEAVVGDVGAWPARLGWTLPRRPDGSATFVVHTFRPLHEAVIRELDEWIEYEDLVQWICSMWIWNAPVRDEAQRMVIIRRTIAEEAPKSYLLWELVDAMEIDLADDEDDRDDG